MSKKTDYTTSISTLLERAVDDVVDIIAKDGLSALKSALDDAGFGEFDSLKNYEIFAHVLDNVVTFEIQVDFEALDEETKSKLEPEKTDQRIRKSARTYALSGIGGASRRIVGRRDARTRMIGHPGTQFHDARKPARSVPDARRGSEARLAGHELVLRSPRGISITDRGKISITLEKIVQTTDGGVRFPHGDFEGIMKSFMNKLNVIISDVFVPELTEIISRNLK